MKSNTLFSFLILLFLFSCNGENSSTPKTTEPAVITQPKTSLTRTTIGQTDFTIDLPTTFQIEEQKGIDFLVYYFTPIDSTSEKGEAGIYFGPKPDQHPPSTEYTKIEIPGIFLGDTAVWIEYTTDKYKQRETFIEKENGEKIHVWCYSNNVSDLEELFTLVNSISEKR